ncbi:MAG TPA: restriction endonuclease subunit S [Bryobacteraceae bacterium]|nr:restriction endonuclease subunit S [Bryobacteraceae bacterium]
MDERQFIANFEHIIRAPGGITRVRELVLQLAVSGRLVEPQTDDITADQLIRNNLKRQTTAITEGRMKRQPLPNPISERDAPWTLPKGWVWTRLGTVTNYGDAPKLEYRHVQPNTWVVELEDIERITSRLLARVRAQERPFKSTKNGFPAGAVLYGKLRPYLDKVIIADEPGVCSTEICPISFYDGLDPRYLRWYLKTPFFVRYASALTYGMNLPRLGVESAREAPFSFPPAESQERIVTKLEELLALCDQLEAQQQNRRYLQNSSRQSALQVLSDADVHEVQGTASRLNEHFTLLFANPEDIEEVIDTYRVLAVRGFLCAASSAQVEVDAIKASCADLKNQYIASGLSRRQQPVGALKSITLYPEHWPVVPFDDVAVVIGGVTKGRDLRGILTITCQYLSVANVQRGFFNLRELKSIQIPPDELAKYLVHTGDLLITEGGDWDKVGRTAIWRGEVENCLHQNHVFKARVPSKYLMAEWVELVFNSGVGRDYFKSASKQTTNLASINMTQLRSFPLPIPPLAEQRAILQKLNTLTATCIGLRRQLKRKQDLAALLAESMVANLTGGGTERNEDSFVKAPETELIARLQVDASPDVKDDAPLAAALARSGGELSARDLWQRFAGDIDAFYAQLKGEVARGWIREPEVAEVHERAVEASEL